MNYGNLGTSNQWQVAHGALPLQIAAFGLDNTKILLAQVLPLLVDQIYLEHIIKPEWQHDWATILADHGIHAITCPIPDINGQLPTVITLPAFSIDVVYLKTRSRSVHAGRQSASTACVLDAGPVPPVPLQVQGQALVPSILPIARISWTLPRTATRSRAQFRPEPEAISIELVRRWQTWAVDPHGNGTCCTTFNFTIPWTLHPHHLYCHISLRQVEDPDEQARSWPPSPKIHWELRAMFNGVVEPVLDVLLRFEPRVRRQ